MRRRSTSSPPLGSQSRHLRETERENKNKDTVTVQGNLLRDLPEWLEDFTKKTKWTKEGPHHGTHPQALHLNQIRNILEKWSRGNMVFLVISRKTEFAKYVVVCKYSQLHMSVTHDHEHERTERKTSRLQPTHTPRVGSSPQSHPGLCGTPVVPARTPTVHRCPNREGRGWPDKVHDKTTDTRQRQVSRQTCFQPPGDDTHLETYMVVEPVRETGDLRRDVVKLREQSRSGDFPNHQEDRSEKRNRSPRRRSPRKRSTTRPSTLKFPAESVH